MLYDPQVRHFLETFLSFRSRGYEAIGLGGGKVKTDMDRRVLVIYLRLVGDERKVLFTSDEVYGKMLYERRVVDLPKVRQKFQRPFFLTSSIIVYGGV